MGQKDRRWKHLRRRLQLLQRSPLCQGSLQSNRFSHLSVAAPRPAAPDAAVAAQEGAESAPLAQLSHGRVLHKLLQLARDIRRPRTYIGYSALVCFALARGCRPFVWEGESRVDLISVHAPWAMEVCPAECVVDAVVCCMVPAVAGGHAEMMPVFGDAPSNR